MDIKDYKTASIKLKWLISAYQLWILDQEFLLELKLVLDHDFNYLLPMLKSNEIKTEAINDNSLRAIFELEDGNLTKMNLSYPEIEKLYRDILDSVDANLTERNN